MSRNDVKKACVIGAGPNGLAAAIILAKAGLHVDVYEAEPQPGGGARTLELTLPGFFHDFGSAAHPLAASSLFFSSLQFQDYELEWIHSPAPVAHPLDDGTAVILERDLKGTESALGRDGKAWRKLFGPFVDHWTELCSEVLGPVSLFPKHPVLMARFGWYGLPSAKAVVERIFNENRTKALFAGLAAHSFLSLDEMLSGAYGILLGIAAHAVGWPIPRGGAQSITNALCKYLSQFHAEVKTSIRIESLAALPQYDAFLCDVTPRQLLTLAGARFAAGYRRQLKRFRYGPGVFKLDYALNQSIPWKAPECLRAATVHVGGTFEEIATSEKAVRDGRHPEQPFVLLVQPSLFDSTRAPQGKHTAWAYCHVPNGSEFNMLSRLEAQIERFAPGFRDCVLSRRVFSPKALEAMDGNLVGGDIVGGAVSLRQTLFRPTWRHYATPDSKIYICSASTPPGGGVHGMCGYHAAKLAVSRLNLDRKGSQ
jgi:phytoene dehydrogenase-like protein